MFASRFRSTLTLMLFANVLPLAACSINLPEIPIPGVSGDGAVNEPFLMTGTFQINTPFGGSPCRVWEGDNSVTYHLFQDIDLDSTRFDIATTEGTRARLLLQERSDLEVGCEMGPVVVVLEVRDIL